MHSALLPARALIDPTGAVPASVSARRWALPLIVLVAAAVFSALALAARWDAAGSVLRELGQSGELQKVTEKELSDQIVQASRVKLVAGVAKAVFLMPLFVLLFAVAVKVAGWLIGRSIRFMDAFTVVAVALLPIALFHVVFGVVALSSPVISDAQVPALIPHHLGLVLTGLSPQLGRLASVADFFNVWSALLLGVGFSSATGMARWKGLLFGLSLYLLFAGVFLVGLPALAAGGGGR